MKAMIAGAILTLATLTGSASAAPLGGIIDTQVGGQGLVTQVATFVCRRDDRGWHYLRGKRRVTCRPARPRGMGWGWHCEGRRCGWWHGKDHRWND